MTLPEDRDVWTNVWGASVGHFENDAILVYRGQLAIKDTEDLSLASCFLEEPLPEKLRPSTMQRLAGYVHQGLLGALGLPFRRLNNDRVRA